jgi:hypothetical protein
VSIGQEWLLDPTLDQANKEEWGAVCVRPLVIPITEDFFSGETIFLRLPEVRFRYTIFPRQIGFKSAPDARPSHWMPLAKVFEEHCYPNEEFDASEGMCLSCGVDLTEDQPVENKALARCESPV